MEQDKYLILCLNTAHPTNKNAFFLLDDEDGNTLIFNSKNEAGDWINENGMRNDPFAYTILFTGDFYEWIG